MPFLYPTQSPRVFAHRGLALDARSRAIDENTLEAFERANEVGATHIESDIQVTADGQAVLFHDDDLSRVAGKPLKVADLDLSELQGIRLEHGGRVPTLQEALKEFPSALFNLDFKVAASVEAGAQTILQAKAMDRVLVASFSDRRRRAALALLPESASSAGSASVLKALAASLITNKRLRNALVGRALTGISALQIPAASGPLRLDGHRFLQTLEANHVEAHYWTVNEPAEMRRLVALGASGVVTDRADLAVQELLG